MAIKCPTCHSDNPETSRFCAGCGTQLPPPQTHPPVVTETLQTPVHELAMGSTLAGRYQIIEELGKGGMGRVYKVLDTKIKEKIALKLIKSEIAADKEALERFGNELRLARKIRHKNICGMFDLGEAEGAHFITMEYVHGEDLKSMIRMAAGLSIGAVLSIGKQVCEGLIEAHSLGIVHRDLKPQNIMIDKGGNAKIMDFGIARSIREEGITGSNVLIGTPEYMSPEQAEAKDVDQRSDIYSLGIILYEMATGRVPFEGKTALSIAMKHKSELPNNPKQINPHIPDELSAVILKCLEKDKAKRYQNTSDVRAELDEIEKGIPTTEQIVPEMKPITSREITLKFTPKKLIMPGLVLLAFVAAGVILLRLLPSKKSVPPLSAFGQPILAILNFENKSGDQKLDSWRDILSELLITSLSQSKYLRVISGEEMYTILKRLNLAEARRYSSEDIEKIAAWTRATHILRGSFIKAGENFIITAGLQKPGTRDNPPPLQIEAKSETDIIVKVDELSREVKKGLNLVEAKIAADIENELGKITTSSPVALKYYVEGRRFHMAVKWDQAIACMKKAVEIDPEFAMAYRSMAAAYVGLGHSAEARKYLKKAFELSARLPESERLIIEAMVFQKDENYAKAIEILERLVKAYPGYVMGWATLALVYLNAGEIDKAIECQEFAVQIIKTAMAVGNLATYYLEKGLYQKAEDVCRAFLEDVEENSWVHDRLGWSYLLRRQFDLALAEAEKVFLLRPDLQERIGEGLLVKGDVLLLKGDIAGAEKVYQQVFDKNLAGGRRAQYFLALMSGKYAEAVNLLQKNLEESKGNKENEARACRELVDALEKAERFEEAYKVLDQYLRLSADNRRSTAEASSIYLPSQQKADLFIKGRIQAELESFDEASKTAEELRSLIDKGVNKKELRFYEYILGLIEFGKKNYRKAEDFFGRASERLDFEYGKLDGALYFDARARAFYGSGDLDSARKEFEKITFLTFGRLLHGDLYAKAFFMLGQIAEQQGDKPRARENYRKFLDLWKDADPSLPQAEDARKRLAGLKDR